MDLKCVLSKFKNKGRKKYDLFIFMRCRYRLCFLFFNMGFMNIQLKFNDIIFLYNKYVMILWVKVYNLICLNIMRQS